MSREVMQQALEALEVATTPLAKDRQEVLRAISVLHKALAQPLPGADWSADMRAKLDVYMAQPEQEPMHPKIEKLYEDFFDKCFRESPTERQPLTDTEILKCFAESDGTFISSGRAIEAAHGIGDKT